MKTLRLIPGSLVFSLAVCAAAQSAAPQLAVREIVVDGVKMRAASHGLAERKRNSPVVVFEAGAGTPLESWGPLVGLMSPDVSWVAYTRSGVDGTEWDKATPTPEHVSDRLVKLLQAMKVEPPYVIVGHSWGGTIARYFVGRHPKLVAGVVYLDPGPIVTRTKEQELALFQSIGSGEKGMAEFWSVPNEMAAAAPAFVKREFETFASIMGRSLEERKVPQAPSVPAVAIIAGKYTPHPWKLSFDHSKYFEAELRQKMNLLGEWVLGSPRGRVIVDKSLDHGFVWSNPSVVVEAIKYVLSKS